MTSHYNLPINRVAERYGTTKHSVYRWMRDDLAFPVPLRLPSGLLRWSAADLDAWDVLRKASRDDYA